jgi:hypothetical protein
LSSTTCLPVSTIDGGLWDGIRQRYHSYPDILAKTHCVHRIKNIQDYENYETIMGGCRLITRQERWRLFEVEVLWQVTPQWQIREEREGGILKPFRNRHLAANPQSPSGGDESP